MTSGTTDGLFCMSAMQKTTSRGVVVVVNFQCSAIDDDAVSNGMQDAAMTLGKVSSSQASVVCEARQRPNAMKEYPGFAVAH